MTVYTLQVNMTRGEVTPLVHARVDTEHYQAGLARAKNWVVMRFGGMTRMPGTIYQGPAKNAGATARFIPFRFNRAQVYAIEAGPLYFRFWTLDGRVEVAGVPVEVVTPYAEDDLEYLQVRQSGDVLYIYCQGYQPRLLTRVSETSWTLAKYTPQDGPYLPINTTGTTLTPASTSAVVPDMTSNVLPSGTAAVDTGAADAFEVFDRDPSTTYEVTTGAGWVSYTFPAGTSKVADAYWLQATKNSSEADRTPSIWTFEGFDGAAWVVLDSRSGETGWAASERRYFEFSNDTAYEAYRLNWQATNDVASGYSAIAELVIHEKADYQTPFNLTASSTAGINGGVGFVAGDVGRPVRLLGSDGKWRWAEIVARVSSTVITVRLHGHALPDKSPTANWRLGAWSDATGWPAAIGIYEDRLIGAGTDDDPIAGWGSVSADYDNFRTSSPLVDDDAVSFRLTGGELNKVNWVAEQRDLVIGTEGTLRAVGRNNQNEAFKPDNIRQRSEANVSTSTALPLLIENMLVFVDGYETRLYEAAYTYEIDGYRALELTALNEHLFAVGVDQIVYQSSPHRIIWARTKNGTLLAATYDREQKVFGVTEADIGGTVEALLPLPGPESDVLFMIVKRTINGADVRYIETLAEFYRENFTVQGVPIYAACAAVYEGAPADTITGLAHLEGETVGIWADGVDVGDGVVTDGELAIPAPFGDAEQVVIGKRMSGRLEGLRLAQIGNRDGSGLGRKVRIVEALIDLYETAGIRVGSVSQLDELRHEDDVELDPYDPPPLRTGMQPLPIDDSWRNNGVFAVETDRMYPATVRGISLGIEGEP